MDPAPPVTMIRMVSLFYVDQAVLQLTVISGLEQDRRLKSSVSASQRPKANHAPPQPILHSICSVSSCSSPL